MRKISGAIGAGLLILGNAAALYAMDDPASVVPFQLYKGYLILVKGSIGPLKSLTFIIDTGVSSTLVCPPLARRLGLDGKARQGSANGRRISVRQVILDDLTVGTVEFRRVPAIVGDISSLPYKVGDADALVGLSALKRLPFSIDYQARELVFGSAISLQESAPFSSKEHLVVPVEVGGQALNLLIDTGAEHLILFRNRIASLSRRLVSTSVRRMLKHAGGSLSAGMVKLPDARLGDSEWKNLEAWVIPGSGYPQETHGVLGIKALELNRVSLDFRLRVLKWER